VPLASGSSQRAEKGSGKGEEYILRRKLGALGRFLVLFLVAFARSLRVDRNGEWYGFGRGLGKTGSRVFRLAGGAAAWASCVVSTSNPGRAEFDILMLAENWPGASFWERIVSPSAAAAMMLAAHFCYCGNTLAK
ncbi:MAG: hypothetical protein R6U98_24070, partial [Pirellulaceae bacterium]